MTKDNDPFSGGSTYKSFRRPSKRTPNGLAPPPPWEILKQPLPLVDLHHQSVADPVVAPGTCPSPNGIQFFRFSMHFRQKAPASDIGSRPRPPQWEILDQPLSMIAIFNTDYDIIGYPSNRPSPSECSLLESVELEMLFPEWIVIGFSPFPAINRYICHICFIQKMLL